MGFPKIVAQSPIPKLEKLGFWGFRAKVTLRTKSGSHCPGLLQTHPPPQRPSKESLKDKVNLPSSVGEGLKGPHPPPHLLSKGEVKAGQKTSQSFFFSG